MSVSTHRSSKSRHVVLRVSGGDLLPDALTSTLRDEGVACGWLRASGALVDVDLRAFDPDLGSLGSVRRIAGPLLALTLEGGIGLVDGEVSISLRALLARETDRGLETLAGEIASARAVAVEAFVTVLDDLVLQRSLDEAGIWLFSPGAPGATRRGPTAGATATGGSAWTAALDASEEAGPRAAERDRTPGRPAGSPAAPQRPARPAIDFDTPSPEAGDAVDHFAFGRCDVVKSDGERLHIKVHKDGRIREIALEMLRVTRVEDSGNVRRFKLERRI